jgi:hypothetical protein
MFYASSPKMRSIFGDYLVPFRLRLRTINLSDALCFRRVGLPSVGTPHGVTG